MRKEYVTPMITTEKFVANEYVAVCWKIGCLNNTTRKNQTTNAPYGNKWTVDEGPYDDVFSHDGSCRVANNNYFYADKNNNITFNFETSSDQGKLLGGFDYWEDVNNNEKVDTNDVIYWHTSNGTRNWNHWGKVESVDEKHINRS